MAGHQSIYDDITASIGRTPMVRLNRIPMEHNSKARAVLGKIEGRNPAYSVKCRIGAAMILAAERDGLIDENTSVIEPTSGNTGIALGYTCAARGYRLILTMPEAMSIERRLLLKAFGAELFLTPADLGMTGAINKAHELVDGSDNAYMPNQFENPAGPRSHRDTTGPEVWEATGGRVDILVAGVGTGGTISGISAFIKKDRDAPLVTVAVEPEASPVITQTMNGEELRPAQHGIQGIGAGFVPRNLDLSLVDRVERVSDDEAYEFARRLAREEGVICGISSGAAVCAAMRLAATESAEDKVIVVILPDSGERYLTTNLYRL